jgi:GAF domain-containing protein
MEIAPEVRAAAERLSELLQGEPDLTRHLHVVSQVAELLVPSLVGCSVTVHVDGDPFTLSSVSEDMAVLDATQYIDGGPCVDALHGDRVDVDDVLSEERWQLYGRTATDRGVQASLSLPLRSTDDQVIGALNLYASEPGAFKGNEAMLAEVFGVRVADLVTNADLSFRSRDWAGELPQRVEALEVTVLAARALAARTGWAVPEARTRLADAAQRAGAPIEKVAQAVLSLSEE